MFNGVHISKTDLGNSHHNQHMDQVLHRWQVMEGDEKVDPLKTLLFLVA